MEKEINLERNNEEILLNFLQKTKEGKYAKIELSSLSFVRIHEKSEIVESVLEDSFYYSVR